jgi:hypothetical protein
MANRSTMVRLIPYNLTMSSEDLKCRGEALGTQVPGVQLHHAPREPSEDRTSQRAAADAEGTRFDACRTRPITGPYIEDLNPLLPGWITYFWLSETKGVLEELDGWLRRRLRCLLWRQWKRPATRARNYGPWDWTKNVRASAPAMVMVRGGMRVHPT